MLNSPNQNKSSHVNKNVKQVPLHTLEAIKLDAKTGEILYQIEYEGDREVHADTEFIPPHEKIIKEDRTSSKIYQTYNGKSYTYGQWLKFKEEFHGDNLK